MWEIMTGERPKRGNQRQPRVPEECPPVRVRVQAPRGGGGSSSKGGALLSCSASTRTSPLPPRPATAQEALQLMEQCGSLDPTARPTAQQLLQRLSTLLEAQQAAQQSGSGPGSSGGPSSGRPTGLSSPLITIHT